jgi:predicted enzyme related to lactoylglutathione lyase
VYNSPEVLNETREILGFNANRTGRRRDALARGREPGALWYDRMGFVREGYQDFEPRRAPFMLNYRVDDLDALLEALRAEGVQIDPKREDADYGRFAWIMDPEGNKIELWEPPKE